MKRIMPSLHTRMALVLVLMLAVVAISVRLGAQRDARQIASDDTDARLQQVAITLAATGPSRLRSAMPDDAASATIDSVGASERARPVFALRTNGGDVLFHSPGFPQALTIGRAGYTDRRIDGRAWRVLSRRVPEQNLVIQVAIDAAGTDARASAIGRHLQGGLLWLLPVLAVIGLLALWQGLAPVRRMRRALARIDARHPAPLKLHASQLPREFSGLAAAIDGLMHRLARVLERQRIFSAAANHELRTPLAGCHSQIEVARRAGDAAQRATALDRIDERVAYMTHLAGQLQRLAEASHLDTPGMTTALAPLVRRVVVDRHARAEARGISIDVAELADTVVAGDDSLTASLIDNLLKNAIDASPADTTVELRLTDEPGGPVLRVIDAGPGTAAIAGRLFEPFYQADTGGAGAGLGLAIVQAVAEVQNATVVFDNDSPKHAVIVCWPQSMHGAPVPSRGSRSR